MYSIEFIKTRPGTAGDNSFEKCAHHFLLDFRPAVEHLAQLGVVFGQVFDSLSLTSPRGSETGAAAVYSERVHERREALLRQGRDDESVDVPDEFVALGLLGLETHDLDRVVLVHFEPEFGHPVEFLDFGHLVALQGLNYVLLVHFLDD